MANYFTLTLDTTAPASPSFSIENGAQFATQQLVNTAIGTTDSPTTGYQMKIWGDVDTTYNANIQATESASQWITYNTAQQVKLSTGDGAKTLNLKIRDDVFNESAIVTKSITLDTTIPIVTATSDISRISKIAGKNLANITFSSDTAFVEFKIKVVPSSSSLNTDGYDIPTTGGSTGLTGTAGNYVASTNYTAKLYGADLQSASTGDGAKVIKVFVKDAGGNWSV